MSGKFLGREALRTPHKRRFAEVPLPEMGLTARLRSLTAREHGEYEAQFVGRKGPRADVLKVARVLLAIATVCDEQGNLVYTAADVRALSEWDGIVLARIEKAARELTGITDDDFEDLVKNSAEMPAADSPSD